MTYLISEGSVTSSRLNYGSIGNKGKFSVLVCCKAAYQHTKLAWKISLVRNNHAKYHEATGGSEWSVYHRWGSQSLSYRFWRNAYYGRRYLGTTGEQAGGYCCLAAHT